LRIETQSNLPWLRRTRAIVALLAIAIMPAACASVPANQSAQTNPANPVGVTASGSAVSAGLGSTPAGATATIPAPTLAAPPPATHAAPVVTHHASPPPAPPAPPKPPAPQPVHTSAKAQSCYPLTNGGKCYSPGEYCRDDDHGASGIDADGDAIKCEDNDGWRWERG